MFSCARHYDFQYYCNYTDKYRHLETELLLNCLQFHMRKHLSFRPSSYIVPYINFLVYHIQIWYIDKERNTPARGDTRVDSRARSVSVKLVLIGEAAPQFSLFLFYPALCYRPTHNPKNSSHRYIPLKSHSSFRNFHTEPDSFSTFSIIPLNFNLEKTVLILFLLLSSLSITFWAINFSINCSEDINPLDFIISITACFWLFLVSIASIIARSVVVSKPYKAKFDRRREENFKRKRPHVYHNCNIRGKS